MSEDDKEEKKSEPPVLSSPTPTKTFTGPSMADSIRDSNNRAAAAAQEKERVANVRRNNKSDYFTRNVAKQEKKLDEIRSNLANARADLVKAKANVNILEENRVSAQKQVTTTKAHVSKLRPEPTSIKSVGHKHALLGSLANTSKLPLERIEILSQDCIQKETENGIQQKKTQVSLKSSEESLKISQQKYANCQQELTNNEADTVAAEKELEQAKGVVKKAESSYTAWALHQWDPANSSRKKAYDQLETAQNTLTSLLDDKDRITANLVQHEQQVTTDKSAYESIKSDLKTLKTEGEVLEVLVMNATAEEEHKTAENILSQCEASCQENADTIENLPNTIEELEKAEMDAETKLENAETERDSSSEDDDSQYSTPRY